MKVHANSAKAYIKLLSFLIRTATLSELPSMSLSQKFFVGEHGNLWWLDFAMPRISSVYLCSENFQIISSVTITALLSFNATVL